MIGIQVDVQITNEPKLGMMPASEWMFGPVDAFRKLAAVYSPYWTGALRSSVDMDEFDDGSGWMVTAGADEIINPITKTPTSEYAPIQEAEKGFMIQAYLDSGVKRKLDDAAERVLR